MKEIQLKKMRLKNFRGANTEVTFTRHTTIRGWNGSGKSRNLDAFRWCLFGKDSQDRKDYEIKTRENGKPLRKVDSEVEIWLDVNGQEIKFTRTLKEVWVKPRGQEEEVFRGNETVTYIDDVPMKVSDYDARVSEVMTDQLFKMVTDPNYFCNMAWDVQREALFEICGRVSDEEVLEMNPEYSELMKRLAGRATSDYKKSIAATKTKAKVLLSEIQPRIDQTHELMPVAKDWALLENQLRDADEEIAQIDAQLQNRYDVTSAERERISRLNEKINQLKQDQNKLVQAAEEKENALVLELTKEHYNKLNTVTEHRGKLKLAESTLKNEQQALNDIEKELGRLKEKKAKLLERFSEIANKVNDESQMCPHCGQRLPKDMLEDMADKFLKWQNDELDKIEADGKDVSEQISALEGKHQTYIDAVKSASKKVTEASNTLKLSEDILSRSIPAKPSEIIPENVGGWLDLQDRINALEKEKNLPSLFGDESQSMSESSLKAMKKDAVARRDEIKHHLSDRETIANFKKNIERLEQEGKRLAAEIAGYEREEFILQSFVRDKIAAMEEKINGAFRFVQFQLFRYTIEGNPSETCIPLVDGIPYGAANTAGRLFAGFDIIRVLSDYYGIKAPIFIDNCEALSTIPELPNQMILMEVSRDEDLRGKLEIINS